MIILEWIDLGWKTTFSEKLAKISNTESLDNPYKPGEPDFKENTINYYHKVLDWKYGENIICDRLWISQLIYWKYKRNEIMSEDQITDFIDKSNKVNATFIFFLPSDEELERRFNIRGDEYVTLEEIKELKKEYIQFLEKYWNRIHYNIISK